MDNTTRDYVFSVIQEKGFHDQQLSQLQSLTFRQLCHLVTEAAEFRTATFGREEEYVEELADIAIVFLDLLGLHQLDVPKVEAHKHDLDALIMNLFMEIGDVANMYRKKNMFFPRGIWRTLYDIAATLNIDLEEAVLCKMEKNAKRPKLYGVAL